MFINKSLPENLRRPLLTYLWTSWVEPPFEPHRLAFIGGEGDRRVRSYFQHARQATCVESSHATGPPSLAHTILSRDKAARQQDTFKSGWIKPL